MSVLVLHFPHVFVNVNWFVAEFHFYYSAHLTDVESIHLCKIIKLQYNPVSWIYDCIYLYAFNHQSFFVFISYLFSS